jgi:hypothetical protein
MPQSHIKAVDHRVKSSCGPGRHVQRGP